MDRRTVLALAASLPAFAAAPAAACSVVGKSPRVSGLQTERVRNLFTAWLQRDESRFRGLFTNKLMADGTLMEPELARAMLEADPIPEETFAIFDRFFTDESARKQISFILNTDAGIIVAAAEGEGGRLQPDCSGMPELHLFLVTMAGLNLRSISHIASAGTIDPDTFTIWTEGDG